MANSTREDYSEKYFIQYILPMACPGILILAGLVIQLFIVAVHVIDWLKGRPVTGADQIFTSFGILRILFHITSLLHCILVLYCFNFPKIFIIFTLYTMYSSAFSNICLSTLHFIFIYFKISTVHSIFSLRLKAIISRRLIYLIIACVLLSSGYSLVFVLITPIMSFCNSTQVYISDYGKNINILSYSNSSLDIFPFLIVFVVSVLLIILLGNHISRMSSCGNGTSSTDVYHRTLKFIVVSVLIWAFVFIIGKVNEFLLLDPILSLFIANIFPTLHSALFIYVSTKLRNQFFRIVHCEIDCLIIHYGADCLVNGEAPGPRSRELMEMTPV
ncbi:taste receptor type 2 member 116-like [Lithobates pipiens]